MVGLVSGTGDGEREQFTFSNTDAARLDTDVPESTVATADDSDPGGQDLRLLRRDLEHRHRTQSR